MFDEAGDKNGGSLAVKTENQPTLLVEDVDGSFIKDETFWERLFSWRWFIITLLHLSFILNMLPVVTTSMSLVCMCGPVTGPTNNTLNNSRPHSISMHTESASLGNVTMSQKKVYEFDWSTEIRGVLISGYLFTNFLAPLISNVIRDYIGNKLTLTLFNGALAFLSFLTPFSARTSVYFFLTIRILSGLCLNTNFPISADTIAWWLPPQEKLTGTTFVIAGWMVGGSIGPIVAGYFCEVDVDNGWPLIYYLYGVITLLWTIVWHCLSSRKPENHAYISEKEKAYILARRVGLSKNSKQLAVKTPYRTILTSRPVLALVITITLHLWATAIVLTCLPLYMTSVLKFSIPDAGSVIFVALFTRLPGIFIWSALGNWLRRKMSTSKERKICYIIGQSLGILFCFGVSFLDETHKWLASVLVCGFVISATFGGILSAVVPIDMAPRYSGFISSLVASVSTLMSLTSPLTAATITQYGLFEQWRIVWITMTLVNCMALLVFLIFGDASLQSWAVPITVPKIVSEIDQLTAD